MIGNTGSSTKVLTFIEAKLLRGSNVVIPHGYTEIDQLAFFNRLDIETVLIPDSVTLVNAKAFSLCKNLTNINIPKSVTHIGESAFWGCEKLNSITLPDAITSIAENAFKWCPNLHVLCSPTSYAYQYFYGHHHQQHHKQSEIVSLFTQEWFNLACKEFIALDIETTGLNRNSDYILEVAVIKYQNSIEVDKFVTLINPKVPIPSSAIAIHGITNKMVQNSPTIDTVIPQLLNFLGNHLLVGHYVNFDIGFIEVWAKQLGHTAKWNYIDTISVAKKMLPGLPNYKLKTVLDAIDYKQVNYHRAEDDCKGCAEIMKKSINHLNSDFLHVK
ncbi:MAG: exonuclease domain-containing protein [Candidatus Bathyarchaeota archaeon]|uniref:exonuclease domain-containing protein n=1 Tax=Candidatus Bathycorpusculum sp. TaxID=2994959 RepID=UPI00281D944C|nr:exonuclease domain-containing protein [Candidatus Termiticorpusculum sp.]MCL2257507.1 exonuclease domain-containing protein [Candidatus Termiticorpusculum sp.]MCL2292349.1 exonuclease domain-containing protein [Candidatus Termiticorpusculum sp.]